MVDRWEYSWAQLDLENGLVGDPKSPSRETVSERGARGWEMVTVLAVGPPEALRYIAFFKRRVAEPRV